jgi:hypothetical protein
MQIGLEFFDLCIRTDDKIIARKQALILVGIFTIISPLL